VNLPGASPGASDRQTLFNNDSGRVATHGRFQGKSLYQLTPRAALARPFPPAGKRQFRRNC